MITKILYGLDGYLLDLVQLFDSGKLPKVLMLSGKKGQGKFTLIHHLMSYIFDKKNYNLKTLSINNSNKLANNLKDNYNQNILYYSCSNKKVKVDDIRSLRIDLQKSSINRSNRFIILDDVEHLNDSCINALLKTIEEPSEINHFILLNNQSQAILDTLKSRSIERMVFLNNRDKQRIIKKIMSNLNVQEEIDLSDTTLTPGNYLKYNKIVKDEKIDITDDLILNIDKLLKLSRSKKNIDFLNFAIHLINQYYFNESKKNADISLYNEKRINIIKKICESNKLNLNHKNIITEIETYI